MADQLATPSDLASLLQQSVDTATATLIIEMATSIVQEAAGNQRILQVAGDVATIMGDSGWWLSLPQIPVTAVASVVLDGTTITAGIEAAQYQRHGNRLWRADGWQTYVDQPSTVVVTNTHGYASGSQDLQLARSAALSLAKTAYSNPSGATSFAIDDYREAYAAMSAQMDASEALQKALARKYGRRAGLVRVG